jgi:hypothetical protein
MGIRTKICTELAGKASQATQAALVNNINGLCCAACRHKATQRHKKGNWMSIAEKEVPQQPTRTPPAIISYFGVGLRRSKR